MALDEEGTVLKPGDPAATRYGVPVSGEIVNAGPSDAFSVRIFAEPELRGRFAGAVLDHTVSRFSETLSTQAMEDAFLTDYRAKDFYFPLLKAGDSKRFFVVVEFAPGDRFLNQLLKFEEERGVDESLPWEDERGQAHRVNAASRTAIGRRLRFKAGDLCAPFESEQDLREWRDRATA